jgi:hypothetical protein
LWERYIRSGAYRPRKLANVAIHECVGISSKKGLLERVDLNAEDVVEAEQGLLENVLSSLLHSDQGKDWCIGSGAHGCNAKGKPSFLDERVEEALLVSLQDEILECFVHIDYGR